MIGFCQCGASIELEPGLGWVRCSFLWLPDPLPRGTERARSDWVLCKACMRAVLDTLEERSTAHRQVYTYPHGAVVS